MVQLLAEWDGDQRPIAVVSVRGGNSAFRRAQVHQRFQVPDHLVTALAETTHGVLPLALAG
ncbi:MULTISPECIES: hypothetical protein [Auritidibacter]|uniref:Uncharacterized protein n=1 Tax=Auritidibacter ignavus TaxID=678932 RepID=A0AAJ6AGY6_9MICC|nr:MULTISPECIES: hypothetical protein [Auritidibacter]PXA81615.1 hypothetical protein DCC26_02400 [Auritidibacter sp. NML120779]PXA75587.1 hypothetical protein DCC24_10560 [Auritidibacter sp. NML100628]PXA79912.1 hypothetical protein DCC25_07425 [Auritidibacter sp. NML120636]WGH80586.1 hypothetical protein QDX25_07135 [Auritidibacter ignavus]WGH85051.1 hypothetical protein QDX20_06025 [Auritidibacter ignavus]